MSRAITAKTIDEAVEALIETPNDPAELGWPPTLPIELALRTATVPELCASYGLTRDEWNALIKTEGFRLEVAQYVELVKKEGVSFQLKARLQAEELLKTSWRLIHDRTGNTPAQVKADLIKQTMKWAGYDASQQAQGGNQNNLQINIVL